MMKTLAVVGIALAVGGGFFVWWQNSSTPDVPAVAFNEDKATAASQPDASDKPASPFDPVQADTAKTDDTVADGNSDAANQAASTDNNPNRRVTLSASEEALALEAYELGVVSLSDEQILDFTLRLKTDKAFLQAVADEFRAETDPARLKRLSFLLGEAQDPALTSIAGDMVYSGNRESELAGLDLLRRLQPIDPAARDVVFTILSTEVDPEVMVGALNVLAMPGQATESERQSIVDSVVPLTQSDSAVVRQRSVSMISKWASGDTATDVLLAGLNDPDESVRKTAAYATLNLSETSPAIVEALFSVLENQDELPRARKGAANSLRSKSLSESDQQRLKIADRQMREQYVSKQ